MQSRKEPQVLHPWSSLTSHHTADQLKATHWSPCGFWRAGLGAPQGGAHFAAAPWASDWGGLETPQHTNTSAYYTAFTDHRSYPLRYSVDLFIRVN